MADGTASTMDVDNAIDKQDVAENAWVIQKEVLEQTNFNLSKELEETREKLADVTRANSNLHEEIKRSASEKIDSAKNIRALESSRNALVTANIELETSVSRLRMEREERDNVIVNLNKEKQQLSVESFALRDQLNSLAEEKSSLTLTLESFKQEKRYFAFEKEKIASEREIFAESKKWFNSEIIERDETIANLKNEMSLKALKSNNEELQLRHESNEMKLKIDELTAGLDASKERCNELIKRIGLDATSYLSQIENLRIELKLQTELSEELKTENSNLVLVAQDLRENLVAKENVLKEVESFMKEQNDELNQKTTEFEENLAEKERQIESLKEDVLKANGLLKSKHAVHVNVTEEELAEMSPAAASTARLLKNDQSLTNIVREYAILSGELAEAKEENKELVEQLSELFNIVQERIPDVQNQKNALDSLFDRNKSFEGQLKDAEGERQAVLNERDAAARELAFTRAELEKYQRDYQRVTKQVQQLMFAQERQRQCSEDESWNDVDDARLFLTVQQLQQRNVQLENDIEKEKTSAAQAAKSAQNSELAALKTELASSKEKETKLQTQIEQLKSALDVVKGQCEHFRDLVKDSVSATEARNARLKAEEATGAARIAEKRVAQLEEHLQVLTEERNRKEQQLIDRLDMSEVVANNLKITLVKAEVTLEEQKKLAAEMQTYIESRQKELDQKQEEVHDLLKKEAKNAHKVEELSNKLLEVQQREATLRKEKENVNLELHELQSKCAFFKTENELQRSAVMKEQQLMLALGEITTRLNRVESEKQSAAGTVSEALKIERDSLKSSLSRLSDQLTGTRNEAKLLQNRLENELSAARTLLSEKEQQYLASESELIDLRSKLASVQSQYVEDDSSVMTPERLKKECQQLKNRIQFLETQLDEAKILLLEANAERTKRDNEKDLVEKHSNVLESNLKEIASLGSMERERLQSKITSLQSRCDELTTLLSSLREEHEKTKNDFGDLQIEAEKESSELHRQLDVARMQLESANQNVEALQTDLTEAKTRVDEHTGKMVQLNLRVSELQGDLAASQEKVEMVEMELRTKVDALVAAQDAVLQADQLREVAETALQVQRSEKLNIENDALEKMKQYETRLDELTTMTLRTADDASMGEGEDSQNSLPTVEMQRNLIQYIREEKNKAITRSLNAEVTMRRLQAETAEYENTRNELLAKIRDLETERATQAAALIEKAKLAEKVEALSSVQRDNAKLQEEKLQLTQELSGVKKLNSDIDMKVISLTAELNNNNMKLTTATSELNAKKREVEVLKKRLETAGRGFAASLQTEIDNLKGRLEEETKQAAMANDTAVKSEKKIENMQLHIEKLNQKFQQTRKLALTYREQVASLQGKGGAEGTPSASNEELEQLKAKIAELTENNEALTKAKNDLEVNQMRMTMLESRMKKVTEQMQEAVRAKTELEARVEKLQADLNTCEQLRKTTAQPQSTDNEMLQPASSTSSSSPLKVTPQKTIPVPRASFAQTGSAAASAPRRQVDPPKQPMAKSPFGRPPASGSIPSPSVAENAPPFRQIQKPLREVVPPVPSETVPDPKPGQQQGHSMSSTMTNPFSSRLPVPTTFESLARVPAPNLFGSTSAQQTPPSEPTITETQRAPTNVLPNISDVPISSNFDDPLLLPEESVTEAGQSSLVSGSAEGAKNQELDAVGDSESRDSASGAGVSSSEGKRKRAATDASASTDVKRVRESSSSEAVTSSEVRQPRQNVDVPELDVLEQDVSDEDASNRDDPEVAVDLEEENAQNDDEEEVEELDDDGEEMMGEEENIEDDDDDSFGGDDEYEEPDDDQVDNIEQLERRRVDDEIIVVSDDDNDDGNEDSIEDIEGEEEVVANDDEVLGGEDSQPSLDDEDREAASAMEEAEDEGRASSGQQQHPQQAIQDNNDIDASAPQDPTGASGVSSNLFEDREDQCSSSNETSEVTGQASSSSAAPLRGRQTARRSRGMRGRGRN